MDEFQGRERERERDLDGSSSRTMLEGRSRRPTSLGTVYLDKRVVWHPGKKFAPCWRSRFEDRREYACTYMMTGVQGGERESSSSCKDFELRDMNWTRRSDLHVRRTSLGQHPNAVPSWRDWNRIIITLHAPPSHNQSPCSQCTIYLISTKIIIVLVLSLSMVYLWTTAERSTNEIIIFVDIK